MSVGGYCLQPSGRNLRLGTWVVYSSNTENLLLRRAKTVVQCTSARQLTGPSTIGELMLLKKKVSHTKNGCRANSDAPLKACIEVTTLGTIIDSKLI